MTELRSLTRYFERILWNNTRLQYSLLSIQTNKNKITVPNNNSWDCTIAVSWQQRYSFAFLPLRCATIQTANRGNPYKTQINVIPELSHILCTVYWWHSKPALRPVSTCVCVCMYVCIYIYIYTHTHTHIHIHARARGSENNQPLIFSTA